MSNFAHASGKGDSIPNELLNHSSILADKTLQASIIENSDELTQASSITTFERDTNENEHDSMMRLINYLETKYHDTPVAMHCLENKRMQLDICAQWDVSHDQNHKTWIYGNIKNFLYALLEATKHNANDFFYEEVSNDSAMFYVLNRPNIKFCLKDNKLYYAIETDKAKI